MIKREMDRTQSQLDGLGGSASGAGAAGSEGRLSAGLEWLLLLVGVSLLMALPLVSEQGFTSDESWYLNQVGYVERHGFGVEFLQHYRGSAGPLFAWFHAMLAPVTQLELPWVRLANGGLFLLTAAALAACAVTLGWPAQAVRRAGLCLIAFAPLWKNAGLAYTEMAALVCATLALAMLTIAWRGVSGDRGIGSGLSRNRGAWLLSWAASLMAAGLAGLAILGRQPLLLMPVLMVLIGLAAGGGQQRLQWVAAGGLAMLPPLFAFSIWGGLQPPAYENKPLGLADGVGFMILSAFYVGAISLLLRPHWLVKWGDFTWRGALGWWTLALAAGGGYTIVAGLPPLATRLQGLAEAAVPLRIVLGLAVVTLGLATLGRLAMSAWQHRRNPVTLLCVLMAGGLICSHLAIGPVFSNRYMAVAAPFLILAWGPDGRGGLKWMGGAALGIAWGALSLWGHLDGRQGPPFWDREMEAFYPHLWEDVPQVFSEHQWEKFDYGNSLFLRNPLAGDPVLKPWADREE